MHIRLTSPRCNVQFPSIMAGLQPEIKRSRNVEIELWRFFLAFAVVLSHAQHIAWKCHLAGGGHAVGAFFLISGYLMMSQISRSAGREMSTGSFLQRKIRVFFPEVVISTIVGCTIFFVASGFDVVHTGAKLGRSFLENICLLKMTGWFPPCGDVSSACWYLSSMILAMAVLYPIVKRRGCHISLIAAAVIIIGYFYHTDGTLTAPYKWVYFTYEGNLRAFAELVMGMLSYSAAGLLREHVFTHPHTGLMLFVKCVLFAALLAQLFLLVPSYYCSFDLVAWIFLTLSFSAEQHYPAWLEQLFKFLGSVSLPLFVSHGAWANFLPLILSPSITPWTAVLVYVALSFLSTAVVMVLAKMARQYLASRSSAAAAVSR